MTNRILTKNMLSFTNLRYFFISLFKLLNLPIIKNISNNLIIGASLTKGFEKRKLTLNRSITMLTLFNKSLRKHISKLFKNE